MSELTDCINNLSAENILRGAVKRGIGPFYLNTMGLSSFGCAEYETVYNAFTTPPDSTRNTIYDTMVCALVDSKHWYRFDAFYFHAAHTNGASEALINWINPGTNDATLHGTVLPPAFTIDQGFLGNGSNNYVDYNFIPSTHGINYTQNSASQILYIRTDVSSAAGRHGIYNCTDNFDCAMQNRNGANAFIKTNDDTNFAGAIPGGDGMLINTRTAASGVGCKKLYRNKVAIVSGSTASLGNPTHSFFSLAANQNGAPIAQKADQVAMAAYADGFTQSDVDTVSDIVNAAMTSLGTNVY